MWAAPSTQAVTFLMAFSGVMRGAVVADILRVSVDVVDNVVTNIPWNEDSLKLDGSSSKFRPITAPCG